MTEVLLPQAFEWTTQVVRRITPDQLPQATPCAGWSVRMLLNHMIGANLAFGAGVPTGAVDPQCDPAVDLFADDPTPAYAASWPAVVQAWSDADPGATTAFPWGPIPNAIARQLLVGESVVHGWDLARATGQEESVPPDLVAATSELAIMLFTDPANRGTDFAPPVPVPADTTATARLVAFLGRHP